MNKKLIRMRMVKRDPSSGKIIDDPDVKNFDRQITIYFEDDKQINGMFRDGMSRVDVAHLLKDMADILFRDFSPGCEIERLKGKIEELFESPCKIAMNILQNEIKAFCDRHKLDFVYGNGAYFFMTKNKKVLDSMTEVFSLSTGRPSWLTINKNSDFWKRLRHIEECIKYSFDRCENWPDSYKSEL